MNYLVQIFKSGLIAGSISSALGIVGILIFEKPIPREFIIPVGFFWVVAAVVIFQEIRDMSKQQRKNIALAFSISSISILVLAAFSLYVKNLLQT